MEKFFICKKGWARHSKGTIINEWEYNKLATESKEQFFEPYVEKPKGVFGSGISEASDYRPIEIPETTEFEQKLTEELEVKGIKTKFKHTVKDGKPELDATFTFDKPE